MAGVTCNCKTDYGVASCTISYYSSKGGLGANPRHSCGELLRLLLVSLQPQESSGTTLQ